MQFNKDVFDGVKGSLNLLPTDTPTFVSSNFTYQIVSVQKQVYFNATLL